MKILIVDDSRLARKELWDLLQDRAQKLNADDQLLEAADAAEAIALINAEKPDLVLLDIHLPDGDGFDVLEAAEFTPPVIFTTAYEQHALQAFEYNALDYLLKPITYDRLNQSLERIAAKKIKMNPSKNNQQFFLRDGEKCHFVHQDEIFLINVDGNAVHLFFRDTQSYLNKSLSYVEQRLATANFFRANRQQLINLNFIANIEPAINEGLIVFLKDGTEVDISRRQAKELKERLEF